MSKTKGENSIRCSEVVTAYRALESQLHENTYLEARLNYSKHPSKRSGLLLIHTLAEQENIPEALKILDEIKGFKDLSELGNADVNLQGLKTRLLNLEAQRE